jgi:hypothetical protein
MYYAANTNQIICVGSIKQYREGDAGGTAVQL